MLFPHLATRPIDEFLCTFYMLCICIQQVTGIACIIDIHTSMFNFIIFCNKSIIEHQICIFLSRPNSINQKACTKNVLISKCCHFIKETNI